MATSISGCNIVLEAPPPKTRLAGFSGSKAHPQSKIKLVGYAQTHFKIIKTKLIAITENLSDDIAIGHSHALPRILL
jgi:hypothetical protein